jgi:opacity protein-like surface antigen
MDEMTRITFAGIALAITSMAAPVSAQQPWSFELRVNGDVPTQDIGADELGTGLGFEGTLGYRFLPHLGAYAGWDWIHFNPEASFAGADMDFEETGYVFGLRFEHPFRGETGGPAWWVRAGGTVDHIEIEDQNGGIIADSGHGLGWEAGAGVAIEVLSGWSFTPGVRYRSLSRDIDVGSVTTPVDLRYVAFELGFARRF